ncbi:TetR family transcriptional regulator [Streptomyces sp. Ag109_O5-1]|nr:TetR family transcriptional regulator [Streptomyces sp. Ag109_O5-1]
MVDLRAVPAGGDDLGPRARYQPGYALDLVPRVQEQAALAEDQVERGANGGQLGLGQGEPGRRMRYARTDRWIILRSSSTTSTGCFSQAARRARSALGANVANSLTQIQAKKRSPTFSRPPGSSRVTEASRSGLRCAWYGLQRLTERFGERVAALVRDAGAAPPPRALVGALLMAALPTGAESRTFHLLCTSYAVLAVTDPALAAQPFLKDPDAAERTLAGLLRQAREPGLTHPGVAPELEAVGLLAMSAGLGSSVLAGQRSLESAVAVLAHHLDRIFRAAGKP